MGLGSELKNVRFASVSFPATRREFAATIQRPFGVRYNAYTQSVEVLSSAEKLADVVKELRGDLCIVGNALRKIRETGGDDGFVDLDALKTVILQMDDKAP